MARRTKREAVSTSWRPLPHDAELSSTHPAAVAFGPGPDGTKRCPHCGRRFLIESNYTAHLADDHDL